MLHRILDNLKSRRCETGAVTAEYAILLALVGMAVVAAAIILGLAVAHLFDTGATGPLHG
jgi:Flp pilus assembly pilin Flp